MMITSLEASVWDFLSPRYIHHNSLGNLRRYYTAVRPSTAGSLIQQEEVLLRTSSKQPATAAVICIGLNRTQSAIFRLFLRRCVDVL